MVRTSETELMKGLGKELFQALLMVKEAPPLIQRGSDTKDLYINIHIQTVLMVEEAGVLYSATPYSVA